MFSAEYFAISPEYFTTMGIPLLRGRAFTERDAAAAPDVILINDQFAGKYDELFDSQRHHWFHPRRPPRGVERRDQTGRDDDDDPRRKRGHVERVHHHEGGRQRGR
jgi:hypothetical protein